ncbi:uncharacterized membrane protein HdeD (DUF308 family) [Sporosarcina luteola]|nr:uncharacterized membrane protein HdeD (DUF308 family) [Sporosarcina luteola]
MERKFETSIDGILERISSQLYMFSIILGIVLVILGIALILVAKRSKGKNGKANMGLISIIVGIVAIISGSIQL